MIANPAEFAALVAAGWEPSSVSVWTAEGNATLLRRGDAVLHVTVTDDPEADADGVLLQIPAGPYWTRRQPARPAPAPVAAGSALELADFCLRPKSCRSPRTRRHDIAIR